jgi:ankyrin repeat protein
LSANANVEARTQVGDTALFLAARDGHLGVINLLIDARADVNVSGELTGWTPLIGAAFEAHDAVVERLLNVPGIEFNTANREGWTALMMACARHGEARQDLITLPASPAHDAVVRRLLAISAIDTDAADEEGRTALMIAVEQGRDAAVRLIEAHAAANAARSNAAPRPSVSEAELPD